VCECGAVGLEAVMAMALAMCVVREVVGVEQAEAQERRGRRLAW
jgi:hypothetical protein